MPEQYPQPRLAIMLSAQYSGATLLSLVLNRHPDLSCDGETFPWIRESPVQCGCGKGQIECAYYRTVGSHMLDNGGSAWNWDLFTHLPRYCRHRWIQCALTVGWSSGWANWLHKTCIGLVPQLRKREQAFIEAHAEFMAQSVKFKNARLYIDGTKVWPRAELLARTQRSALKALHLIRDGRAFCNSYVKNRKLSKAQLGQAANSWLKHTREVETFRRRFPDIPLLTVRYEDLCRDFDDTIETICNFLDVPVGKDLLNTEDEHFHILGNRMRFQFQGTIRRDTSWESQLTEVEVRQITSKMRHALRRFGYLD